MAWQHYPYLLSHLVSHLVTATTELINFVSIRGSVYICLLVIKCTFFYPWFVSTSQGPTRLLSSHISSLTQWQSQKSDPLQGSFTGINLSSEKHFLIHSGMCCGKRASSVIPLSSWPCTDMLSTRCVWPLLQAPCTWTSLNLLPNTA